MTGLDVDSDTILEVACVITNRQLDIVSGPMFRSTIHHSDAVLQRMGEWCTSTHTRSGLVHACRASRVSMADADRALYEYVARTVEDGAISGVGGTGAGMLAGNSVHVDRCFLARYMPRVLRLLHHRIIDVSTVMELARSVAPSRMQREPAKHDEHRASIDVCESIRQLRYYYDVFLRSDDRIGNRVAQTNDF